MPLLPRSRHSAFYIQALSLSLFTRSLLLRDWQVGLGGLFYSGKITMWEKESELFKLAADYLISHTTHFFRSLPKRKKRLYPVCPIKCNAELGRLGDSAAAHSYISFRPNFLEVSHNIRAACNENYALRKSVIQDGRDSLYSRILNEN